MCCLHVSLLAVVLRRKASIRCCCPKKSCCFFSFFFLKLETQITEGQYLWQATKFNVLSKWDLGLNGPSYALKAMRSAHHFGPNKGYHHVVAFLTIAHRNPLIKWALCETSYKRACYTIVGSNNNTRRGQLSKRSQSHRGEGLWRGSWGVAEKASGPVWQNVASAERGRMAGKRHSGMKGRQKRNPLPRSSWAWPSEAKRQGRKKTLNRGTWLLSQCMSWMSNLLVGVCCRRNLFWQQLELWRL